jgi:hypothetical protein
MIFSRCQKKRIVSPESFIQEKYPPGMKRKIKTFSEKKLKEFVASRPTPREWLKEIL